MLWQRVATAAIGIPATMVLIYYGGTAFFLTVLTLALLGYGEYVAILRQQGINVAWLAGGTGITFLLAAARWGNSYEQLSIVFFFCLYIMTSVVYRRNFHFTDAAMTVVGFLYIGVAFAHFILLRFLDGVPLLRTTLGEWPLGVAYLVLTLLSTWAADIFAFFIGSWWGKHKLCPHISPGKTWEGLLGGIVGTLVVSYLAGWASGVEPATVLVPGVIVAVVGPIGDLAESAVKRFAGVKDSGRLLPGHGGVLDRLDSLMFTIPFVYFYVQMFIVQ